MTAADAVVIAAGRGGRAGETRLDLMRENAAIVRSIAARLTQLRSALRDERRILTVSRVQEGACGIRDIAISLPAVVGRQGVAQVIEPQMSPDEQVGLERSVNVLRHPATQLRV